MGHERVSAGEGPPAAGIVCGETTFGALPVGAIFALNSTVTEVLRAWGTASMFAVRLKGRGESCVNPEARVIVIRVVQRAEVRPRGRKA